MSRVTDLIRQYEEQCCRDKKVISLTTARIAGCKTIQEAEECVGAKTEGGLTSVLDKFLQRVALEKQEADILACYCASVRLTAKQLGVSANRVRSVWESAMGKARG